MMTQDPAAEDLQPVPLEFLRRAALVEVDAGEHGKFVMLAPVMDETAVQLGVPLPVTITVTAIAQGADAALALVSGWRELQLAQMRAALQPEAVRH